MPSNAMSRRKVLALVGGGAILAASAGGAAFLSTRTPYAARAPWGLAGQYGEIRRDALSWALLAPNPHNRQPWVAELTGSDKVVLRRDPELDLPHTDPFARQLTVGMGCFIELMVLAAAEGGYGVDLDLYPDGDEGPVANARFVPGNATPDPLFAHASARRSCKEPFDGRPVPADLAAAVADYADVYTEPEMVEALRTLTWEAWVIEMETPRTWKESIDLLRVGKAEIEANPDGIDLSGLMFDTLRPLGLMPNEGMLAPDSMAARQTAAIYQEVMATAPAHVALTSVGNTRLDQIEAGRRWLRLNLATTSLGLALHPVSQALQEYPEMAAPYARAHQLLAGEGETVQMLGRLGYGPEVAQTPRWPLETKLRNA
ncbi:MAG: twin-arginine translocation pathway signal protein [Pseudomonadota bacterium]